MSRPLRSLAVTLACLAALATPLAVSAHSRDGRPGRSTAGRLVRSAAQRTDSDAAVEADRIAHGAGPGLAHDAKATGITTVSPHDPAPQPSGLAVNAALPGPGTAPEMALSAPDWLRTRLAAEHLVPRGPPPSL